MRSDKRHRYENPLSNTQMINLVNNISKHFNTTPEDVIGWAKKSDVLDARMYVVGVLRLHHGLSLRQISELLSDRNHATVIHIYKKFMGMKTCKVKHMKEETESIYSKFIDQKI